MRSSPIICLVTSLFVILCGCKEHRGTLAKRDACSLISKEEVASVQASPVNDIKSSERSDDVFRISQCFYATAESSKSVNLALVESLGDDAYWVANRFGGILYVLKGDVFISVGIGGTDAEDTKLKKSKVLAQKALQHL